MHFDQMNTPPWYTYLESCDDDDGYLVMNVMIVKEVMF